MKSVILSLCVLFSGFVFAESEKCKDMVTEAAIKLDHIDRSQSKLDLEVKSTLWKSNEYSEDWIVEIKENKVKSEIWYTINVYHTNGKCEIQDIRITRLKDDID